MNTPSLLQQQFEGCLLGGAIGDAWGSSYENQPTQHAATTFYLGKQKEPARIWAFTDDTQLTMATCEALSAAKTFDPAILANHFVTYSTRMDEHFWRYDKPFYEFFRRRRLGPLSSEEIHLLLNHWSYIMGLPELAAFTKNNPGKIEAVRILTDGLPRTLQFFIEILLQDSTLYGFDYIRKVMDKVTPLYQERLNNLPAPQRKIILEAAFIWEACTARQLVQKCNMESKLISAHLKQLSNNGIVETFEQKKAMYAK